MSEHLPLSLHAQVEDTIAQQEKELFNLRITHRKLVAQAKRISSLEEQLVRQDDIIHHYRTLPWYSGLLYWK